MQNEMIQFAKYNKPITSYGILCFKLNEHDILFLLVKRKYSLNYIDFIRGKYETDQILSMFNYMSSNELALISKNNFNTLWNNLWQKTAKIKKYSK